MEDFQKHDHQYYIWFRVLILICVTAIVIVSVVMALKKQKADYQFSVSAIGKITAVPDIATISIGVYTDTKQTAIEAVKDNTKLMNEIVVALKGIDIGKKDITTSSYNLNPVYDWTDKRGRTLKGYEIRQNVTVKIRDLDNIGKAIQVTTEKGANQIGGINFTIDDPEDLKNEAIKIAIEKAKNKAENLAKESGLKLGKLVNVYESQIPGPTLRTNKPYFDEAVGMGGGMPEPTIEPGEQEIEVEMTLVYEVK